MPPSYHWRQITLRDLRLAATPEGEITREGDPMTSAAAAKLLHVSQGHLSAVENARQPASVYLLARMRTLYGVPLKVVYEAYAETKRQGQPSEPDTI